MLAILTLSSVAVKTFSSFTVMAASVFTTLPEIRTLSCPKYLSLRFKTKSKSHEQNCMSVMFLKERFAMNRKEIQDIEWKISAAERGIRKMQDNKNKSKYIEVFYFGIA